MLTRPSNGAINNQHITGSSNCANNNQHFTEPSKSATNKQQWTPLLPNPPHHHTAQGTLRPLITNHYKQQNPQLTHHLIYIPVIIVTL